LTRAIGQSAYTENNSKGVVLKRHAGIETGRFLCGEDKTLMPATAGHEFIENEINKASRRFFRKLSFTCALEDQFERYTAKAVISPTLA